MNATFCKKNFYDTLLDSKTLQKVMCYRFFETKNKALIFCKMALS